MTEHNFDEKHSREDSNVAASTATGSLGGPLPTMVYVKQSVVNDGVTKIKKSTVSVEFLPRSACICVKKVLVFYFFVSSQGSTSCGIKNRLKKNISLNLNQRNNQPVNTHWIRLIIFQILLIFSNQKNNKKG